MEVRAIDGLPKRTEISYRSGGDFLKELANFLEWVNEEQRKAESIREAVLKGAEVPLHRVVVELEKARVALNLLIQIRNKLIEALQELNRMQV